MHGARPRGSHNLDSGLIPGAYCRYQCETPGVASGGSRDSFRVCRHAGRR